MRKRNILKKLSRVFAFPKPDGEVTHGQFFGENITRVVKAFGVSRRLKSIFCPDNNDETIQEWENKQW